MALNQTGRIVAGLVEFGYEDVTAQEVEEVIAAIRGGATGDDIPHGALGVLIETLVNV